MSQTSKRIRPLKSSLSICEKTFFSNYFFYNPRIEKFGWPNITLLNTCIFLAVASVLAAKDSTKSSARESSNSRLKLQNASVNVGTSEKMLSKGEYSPSSNASVVTRVNIEAILIEGQNFQLSLTDVKKNHMSCSCVEGFIPGQVSPYK